MKCSVEIKNTFSAVGIAVENGVVVSRFNRCFEKGEIIEFDKRVASYYQNGSLQSTEMFVLDNVCLTVEKLEEQTNFISETKTEEVEENIVVTEQQTEEVEENIVVTEQVKPTYITVIEEKILSVYFEPSVITMNSLFLDFNQHIKLKRFNNMQSVNDFLQTVTVAEVIKIEEVDRNTIDIFYTSKYK